MEEDVISETLDRLQRKNNFLIFKLQDAKNSAVTDKETVINLLSKIEEQPPFNLDYITVTRLGNKFVADKTRPVKVSLPLAEHVFWVLNNKKHVYKDTDISITADATVKQREFRSRVTKALNERKNKGEVGLFIKYVRGVPTIVSDSASNTRTTRKTTRGASGQKK